MAYDEILATRLQRLLHGLPGMIEKKMFGGLCFMLNDKMFCGIVKEELMVRVIPLKYDSLLKEPDVRQMDFTGKPMKGFIYVSAEGLRTDAELRKWMKLGIEYVNTLAEAPKKKKTK